MIERLENIKAKYDELNNLLMTTEVINDIKKATKISKEKVALEDIVTAYEKYKNILKQIDDVKNLIHDSELGPMAKEELNSLEEQNEQLEEEIEFF